MKICKQFIISGRVQGVFYRGSAKAQAIKLGIKGKAKNLANGNVEILACGESHAIDQLEKWLWQGPTAAWVAEVTANEQAWQELTQFITE